MSGNLACPEQPDRLSVRHHCANTGPGNRRAVDVEAGLTQIRVRELASELNVSTQEVLSFLEELGKKVRGPSTVIGVSAAAKIRGRFRLPRSTSIQPAISASISGTGQSAAPTTPDQQATSGVLPVVSRPAVSVRETQEFGNSLFLPPVAPPIANVTPATAAGAFANPFAVPTAPFVSPVTSRQVRPAAVPAQSRGPATRVAPAPPKIETEPEVNYDADWEARGISAADRESWQAAGLRPAEAGLVGLCNSAGIAASDLGTKLSGRTALQRLRDGEATTSVWARIREAEQQPRRTGTKLTGRFQLS